MPKAPSGSGLALGLGISGLHKDDADYFTLYNGSRNESTIVFTWKSEQTSQHETKNVKTYDLTTWTMRTPLTQVNKTNLGAPEGYYRINWEIYTPYAGSVGMLLHINEKITMGKLKNLRLS